MSSNDIINNDDTPVRLPKLSQISERDLMEINLSQEDKDEIIWFEKEESSQQQHPHEIIDINNKENSQTKKRRKRLMKYDSSDFEMLNNNPKKSTKESENENKVTRKTSKTAVKS